MNNLFFSALCLALLYYFFFYLPSQKTNANLPFKQNQATQTEPEIAIIDPGPEKEELIATLKEDNRQKERTIIGLNNSYQKLETKKTQAIESLKADLTDSQKAQQKLLEQVQELKNLLNTWKDGKVVVYQNYTAPLKIENPFINDEQKTGELNFKALKDYEQKLQHQIRHFSVPLSEIDSPQAKKQMEEYQEELKRCQILLVWYENYDGIEQE